MDKTFYKVCKVGGKPLFNGDNDRPCPMVEKANLDEDENKDCANGIYFCEARQLPLWWQDYDTEIRLVVPQGRIIKVEKGCRTDELEHVRILSDAEIEQLGKENGFDWKERVQFGKDHSTQTAGNSSSQNKSFFLLFLG